MPSVQYVNLDCLITLSLLAATANHFAEVTNGQAEREVDTV
jgi:hypothetical protein